MLTLKHNTSILLMVCLRIQATLINMSWFTTVRDFKSRIIFVKTRTNNLTSWTQMKRVRGEKRKQKHFLKNYALQLGVCSRKIFTCLENCQFGTGLHPVDPYFHYLSLLFLVQNNTNWMEETISRVQEGEKKKKNVSHVTNKCNRSLSLLSQKSWG